MQSICHLITDGKHGDCQNEEGSGFYFISSKDVNGGKIKYENARQITRADFQDTHRRTQLEPLDILITNSGTIGRMAIVKDGKLTPKTTFQKSVAILKPDKKIVSTFWLFYYLRCHEERLISYAGGTAQKNLLLRDLRAFEIKLPSLPLQVRVASILTAYDDLIENNTRRIKILAEMAKLIYREWFVEFKAPGVKLHKASPEEKKLTGKDVFPEGWEVRKFTELVFVNPTVKIRKEGLKPFVPMNGLTNDSMLITQYELRGGNSGSKFQNNDTLFARITPCLENGKTAFVQFMEENDSVAFGSTEFIVLRSKSLFPELVYLISRDESFRNNAIKSMSGATGRQRVQEECFNKFLFPLPYGNTLKSCQNMLAPLFKQSYLVAIKNQNLRRTRDLLLPKLVSGEIEV